MNQNPRLHLGFNNPCSLLYIFTILCTKGFGDELQRHVVNMLQAIKVVREL